MSSKKLCEDGFKREMLGSFDKMRASMSAMGANVKQANEQMKMFGLSETEVGETMLKIDPSYEPTSPDKPLTEGFGDW